MSVFFIKTGRALTLVTLFFLPWQTRYIFWRPWIGTTESEFGVVSLYATMLLAGGAALCFFTKDFLEYVRSARLRIAHSIGAGALFSLAVAAWIHTYPSAVHAWTLQVFCAVLLGYATYKTSLLQGLYQPLLAIVAGFIAPTLLGVWQMVTGFSPDSTLFGLAARNAERLGDAVIVLRDTRILRMYGSFPHPNIFGAALALVFAAMLTARAQQIEELPYKTIKKASGIFIGIIIFVLFCISRTAALALLCTVLAWYGNVRAKKVLITFALALPVLIWSLQFVAPELLVLRGSAPTEMQSVSERVAQVHEWGAVMEQGGVLGVGIFHYPEYLANLDGASRAAWAYQPVHNVFLLMLAELGVLWSVLVLLFFVRAMGANKKKGARFLPIFVCFWTLAWFDHVLWTSWTGMAYASVALAISARRKEI